MKKTFISLSYLKQIVFLLLLLNNLPLMAAASFDYYDWQMVCDNTNTCRVAGYSSELTDSLPVSVLLTRKAGKNQAIKGELKLAYFSEEDEKVFNALPSIFQLEMRINGNKLGFVSIEKGELKGNLSNKQTDALLASPHKKSKIIWQYKTHKWVLSDKGSAAVLIKMDEYQKRLNTVGASYKKGTKNEKNVLAPKTVPLIYAQKISSDEEVILAPKAMKNLYAALPFDEEECSIDKDYDNENIKVFELSSTKALASRLCWRAAYNEGIAYWIINKKQPFNPKHVTNEGSEFYVGDDGVGFISMSQKWRGVGDCWSLKDFVWDGTKFQISNESSTGLCRGFAGGAWSLPTLISNIKVK